jgi:simple sugar transport system permease protein
MNFPRPAKRSKYIPVIAAAVLFCVAFALGSALYPGFFSLQTFLNLLIDKAFLLVSATGMTLVVLTGGIDLSAGSVMALTTMILSVLTEFFHINAVCAIIIALFTGPLVGLLMGLMIACWDVPPFIATLVGTFFARSACYLIGFQWIPIRSEPFYSLALWKLHFGSAGFVSLNVIIATVVVLAGIYVSLFTKFGRSIYAIGGDEQSALYMGIPVKKTKILVYMVNGFCSSFAGVVFSLYALCSYGPHGQGVELDAIAAVVIGGSLLSGGAGYVAGSAFGVVSLGIIQSLITFNGTINSWWTKIAAGGLMLAFIGLQGGIVEIGKQGRK